MGIGIAGRGFVESLRETDGPSVAAAVGAGKGGEPIESGTLNDVHWEAGLAAER
jgi:hypothetical protein